MTVKCTLESSDMRVFALCSLMELHRNLQESFYLLLVIGKREMDWREE